MIWRQPALSVNHVSSVFPHSAFLKQPQCRSCQWTGESSEMKSQLCMRTWHRKKVVIAENAAHTLTLTLLALRTWIRFSLRCTAARLSVHSLLDSVSQSAGNNPSFPRRGTLVHCIAALLSASDIGWEMTSQSCHSEKDNGAKLKHREDSLTLSLAKILPIAGVSILITFIIPRG